MEIDDFLSLTKKRRSIRRFKPDPVPDEYVEKILEAARYAMSGASGQPWEFVVVRDQETRKKIVNAYVEHHSVRSRYMEQTKIEEMRHPLMARAPTTPGFADAPVFIVVCGDPRTLQAGTVIARYLCGEGDATFYVNLGNASHMMHLAAAALGLGSQWVSIWRIVERDLKDILGIPEIFRIFQMVPIGFPAYEPEPLWKRELSEITHYERYDQSRYRTDEDIREWVLELRRTQGQAHWGGGKRG